MDGNFVWKAQGDGLGDINCGANVEFLDGGVLRQLANRHIAKGRHSLLLGDLLARLPYGSQRE